MGIDNRDWYRDLLRKRTGYVERADFRVPANAPPPFKLHIIWRVILFAALIFLALLSIKKIALLA